MKNVKRFLSLILVSIMVLAMNITAFAAGEGTITITNAQADNLEYEAYQVFKGNVDGGKLVDIEWGDGVDSATLLKALQDDTNFGADFANAKTAADVAKVMEKYTTDDATMQKIAEYVSNSLTSNSVASVVSTTTPGVYTIAGLDIGYYFVKDTSGLAVETGRASKYAMIKVVDANAKINIKTEVPSQEKKVKENQADNYTQDMIDQVDKYGTGFNDVADYNVNDIVDFELLSTIPNFKGMKTYYYEFQDEYDTAFTLDKGSIKVEVVSAANVTNVLKTLVLDTDYTLTYVDTPFTNSAKREAKQFNVIISDLITALDKDESLIGEKIKVTFQAKLNEGAVIGRPGNRNRSRLIYGNNPNEQGEPTPWDEVVVFTYELDVDKFDGEDKDKKLQDAEFKFYREVANGVKEYVVVNGDGKVLSWTTDEAQASVLKTDASGTFKVSGLDEGTYWLKETKVPTGYNLLKDPVRVDIAASTNNGHNGADNALGGTTIDIDKQGAAHTPNKPEGYETAPIANNQGVELPETGGIGTTLFYIIGALLALGAGVVLVTRRRMQK